MVALAIATLLAVITVPAYRDHIMRSRIPEATSGLLLTAMRLEQFYQDNRAYGPTAATTCGNAAANALVIADSKYFDYSCTTSNSGQNYTITATGKSSSTVNGYAYTLGDSGAKGTTQYAGTTVTASCWAVKSASDCS